MAIVQARKAGKKDEKILEEHNERLEQVDEAKAAADAGETDITFTEENRKANRFRVYRQTAGKLIISNGPTIALATGSLLCFGRSYGVIHNRYLSMAAAYSSVLSDKLHLEEMIRKMHGQEALDQLKEGEKELVADDVTGDSKLQFKEGQKANYDAYAKFFDESNPNWEKNPETNRFWLHGKENYANYLLKRHGYLFLNDVYDMLGIPKTQAGQIMGWKYYDDVKEAEYHGAANMVLFGILDGETQAGRDFVNGYERSILLKFNIDPEPIIGCVGFREA
jgi:hypothetical protein